MRLYAVLLILNYFGNYANCITPASSSSGVAFMKRFIKCNGWFQWITENIKPNAVTGYQLPEILKPYRVAAIDASDVYTKGAIKQA